MLLLQWDTCVHTDMGHLVLRADSLVFARVWDRIVGVTRSAIPDQQVWYQNSWARLVDVPWRGVNQLSFLNILSILVTPVLMVSCTVFRCWNVLRIV